MTRPWLRKLRRFVQSDAGASLLTGISIGGILTMPLLPRD